MPAPRLLPLLLSIVGCRRTFRELHALALRSRQKGPTEAGATSIYSRGDGFIEIASTRRTCFPAQLRFHAILRKSAHHLDAISAPAAYDGYSASRASGLLWIALASNLPYVRRVTSRASGRFAKNTARPRFFHAKNGDIARIISGFSASRLYFKAATSFARSPDASGSSCRPKVFNAYCRVFSAHDAVHRIHSDLPDTAS